MKNIIVRRITTLIMMCMVFLGMRSFGKTIALWPMGEGTSTADYGACAIDSRNNLTLAGTYTIESRFPSPKRSGAVLTPTLFDAKTEKCIERITAERTPVLLSKSELIGSVVSGTHDFTLEGYVKFSRKMSNGEWWVLARGGSEQNGVWTFRFNKVNSNLAFEMCGIGSDKRYSVIDDTAEDFTNVWHHFALVFEVGEEKPEVEVFFDGVSCGSKVLSASKNLSGTTPKFDIGGRTTEDSHTFLGSFDMWRLSDVALDASSLLNAADPEWIDVPTEIDTSKTIAFWPLTRNADGTLNAKDVVNGNDFSSGYFPSTPYFVQVLPDINGAPIDDNAGAWLFPEGASSSAITAAGVAECLDVGKSFAVEMYLKPSHHTSNVPSSQWVCSTTGANSYSRGWILLFVKRNAGWRFELVACNGGDTTNLARDQPISPYLNDWGETWKKIRLERNLSEQNWKLYIDGVLSGTVEDAVDVIAGTPPSNFTFSGRVGLYTSSFAGSVDDIKLSDDSSTLVAHWPLNVKGGVDLDGAPLVGSVKLTSKDSKFTFNVYIPTAVVDDKLPAITNPDAAAQKAGYTTRATGCAAFQDKSSGMGNQYLAVSSPKVAETLNSEEGFTLEFWMNRTYSLGSSWEGLFFFFNANEANVSGALESGTALATIAVQSSQLLLEDAGSFTSSKTDLKDAGEVWTLAKQTGWQHWAFVHDKNENNSRWRIYVDGVLKSTLSSTWNVTSATIRCLTFGGRYPFAKAFRGRMANVRLSKGVLETNEFLNAKGSPAPTTIDTANLAYWQLSEELLGKTLAEPSGYELSEANGSVSWSVEAARNRVKVADFPYDKKNKGSLVLGANGQLSSKSKSTAFADAFTIEGWFKADVVSSGVIVSTDVGNGGWRLSMSRTNDGTIFSIRNWYGIPYTSTIDAAFPIVADSLLNDWVHIALSHDPMVGCGQWSLFVNGVKIGDLADSWKELKLVSASSISLGDGSLGTAAGAYDMWRLSRGVLNASNLMWYEKQGMFLFFK